MQKIRCILISLALMAPALAVAENAYSDSGASCAEWKSGTPMDLEALEKLRKKSVGEKPEKGKSYTKNQFIVLLAKNLEGARDILSNSKNSLPKTEQGLVDLRDAELNGFNLARLNLDYVDFSGAELNGADLSGAALHRSSLYKAELDGANLNYANLSYANVAKVSLINASMCAATLISSDFEDAVMRGVNLKGAKLDMAKNLPKSIYRHVHSVLQLGLPVPPDHLE